jgi:beta-alanine--pyruvate transaminase
MRSKQGSRSDRITGDTIALSPPLIISENEIGEIFDKVGKVIRQVH